ncbi:hypothetical protein SteCoe_10947 [Stentor coeruleus]|uniref:Uncharacterized protein n=1 Tax=Stentor coeruleus TaxID=5963 RepID=A0A1R2CEC1_9CILI|nr:hypothetical protein SteCoe_10947 [Stentor coeruleus]
MKTAVWLCLLTLCLAVKNSQEPTILATTTVTLQELLEKIEKISEELAQETQIELPLDLLQLNISDDKNPE